MTMFSASLLYKSQISIRMFDDAIVICSLKSLETLLKMYAANSNLAAVLKHAAQTTTTTLILWKIMLRREKML